MLGTCTDAWPSLLCESAGQLPARIGVKPPNLFAQDRLVEKESHLVHLTLASRLKELDLKGATDQYSRANANKDEHQPIDHSNKLALGQTLGRKTRANEAIHSIHAGRDETGLVCSSQTRKNYLRVLGEIW